MSQGSQGPSLPVECSLISERTDTSISLVLLTVLEFEHRMLGQRAHLSNMGE